MKLGSIYQGLKSKTTLLFDIGLILKGIDSLLEIIGGFLLLSPLKVSGYLEILSQHSKHDFISNILEKLADGAQAATLAAALYLIIHGGAKAILIIAALKRKPWGYIGLIAVLTVFAIAEMIRYFETHKVALLMFSLFDGALVLLISHEYQTRYPKGIGGRGERAERPEPGI